MHANGLEHSSLETWLRSAAVEAHYAAQHGDKVLVEWFVGKAVKVLCRDERKRNAPDGEDSTYEQPSFDYGCLLRAATTIALSQSPCTFQDISKWTH
jgi:hypothetical protein